MRHRPMTIDASVVVERQDVVLFSVAYRSFSRHVVLGHRREMVSRTGLFDETPKVFGWGERIVVFRLPNVLTWATMDARVHLAVRFINSSITAPAVGYLPEDQQLFSAFVRSTEQLRVASCRSTSFGVCCSPSPPFLVR